MNFKILAQFFLLGSALGTPLSKRSEFDQGQPIDGKGKGAPILGEYGLGAVKE